MFRNITILVACATASITGFAQEVDNIKTMQHFTQSISEKKGNMIVAQFEQGEAAGLLSTIPEYIELTKILTKNSRDALNNFQAIAPDKASRIALLHSVEELAPEDYLTFSVKSFDLLTEKQIQKDEFLRILLMSPTRKQWFLSYNYQNPGVINFLAKVRSHFASDPKISALVDFILSGKARTRDEILRKENRYFAGQTVDLLPGSSMPTPSQKTTVQQGEGAITPKPETSRVPIVAARQSSFPIVPVVISVAVIVGVIVFLIRRK